MDFGIFLSWLFDTSKNSSWRPTWPILGGSFFKLLFFKIIRSSLEAIWLLLDFLVRWIYRRFSSPWSNRSILWALDNTGSNDSKVDLCKSIPLVIVLGRVLSLFLEPSNSSRSWSFYVNQSGPDCLVVLNYRTTRRTIVNHMYDSDIIYETLIKIKS